MKKLLSFAAFLFLFRSYCLSQAITAQQASGLVPKGWKIIAKASGDLNKDGKNDLALIIEKTDKKNFILNSGLGEDTLNVNPRSLLVAFSNGKAYRLIVRNDGFIPSENNEEARCLADPLMDMENNGLTIARGLLFLSFKYWYSCGTWYVNSDTYTFRWQNNKFELIGYDNDAFHRASLDETKISINYSTGVKATTTGGNLSGKNNNPKKVMEKIKILKKYDLATITADMNFTAD